MRISKTTKCGKSNIVSSSKETNYDKALKYIKCAIDCLGEEAKTNVVAKESIANLGVVMFDIKGNTQK